jgi:hypothetical protein
MTTTQANDLETSNFYSLTLYLQGYGGVIPCSKPTLGLLLKCFISPYVVDAHLYDMQTLLEEQSNHTKGMKLSIRV